jgi:hypothetical protein
MDASVNYLAVLACGVTAIIIGFIWYGPLFGKQWMRMTGIDKATPEEMAKGKKQMPMMAAIQFVGALLMGWVLSYMYIYVSAFNGVSGPVVGAESGFWAWLGFVAPVTVGMVLWEGRPWAYWGIVAGNWLVTLLVMGAIIGAWA